MLTIIRATRDYELALTAWDNKPQDEQTWINLKTHFHEAQQQLKSIRGPSMQQAGYHQANALAQKISNDIRLQLHERGTQMLAMLQTIPALAQSSTDSEDTSEDRQSDYHPTQVAASLTSSSDSI